MKSHFLFGMFFLFFFFPFANLKSQTYPIYYGEVLRVVDGDTLIIKVDIWPRISWTYKVRVLGMDAPELNKSECPEAKLMAQEAMAKVVKLYPVGSRVQLNNVEMDGFGRALALLSRPINGGWIYLHDEMIDSGLAVKWDPSIKAVPWCLVAKTR